MEEKKSIEECIAGYLSGNATEEEIRRLIGWLEAHPENSRYFQRLKNIWQVAHPAFPPDEIDVVSARARVMKEMGASTTRRTAFFHYWRQAAAILLLPLILVCAYLYKQSRSEGRNLVGYQEVFSSYGSFSKINLPDGSLAWLNAGSSLKYPTVFGPRQRDIVLKGEAFFEVESDPEHPFTVRVNGMDVIAVGTQFNVEAYPEDSVMAVTMAKGKVNVRLDAGKILPLGPGQRLGYNRKTQVSSVKKTDPYKWYAWKDGLLIFRDDSLEYVLKKLAQTFNADIRLMDRELASHSYRATFHKESLDEILRLLRLTAPIRYRESAPALDARTSFPPKRRIEVYSLKNK